MTNPWFSVRSSVVLFIFVMMGLSEHSATANMDDVKELLSQMSADLQSVKTQMQETRQELKSEMQSYEAKLQNTRQELKNEMYDKLERDLQAADTQFQKTRQELRNDLESSDTRLQRTCRDLRTDLGFAQTELRKLRQDLRFAETNQSNTGRRLLRLPRSLPDQPNLRSISAVGWTKNYKPGETLKYYWDVHNNQANVMDPDKGEFKVPYPGLYILSFYGAISPDSPAKINPYASMIEGGDEVAYTFVTFDDYYQTGSMLVLRRLPQWLTVYVRNGKHSTVRWEGFGFSVVFITG